MATPAHHSPSTSSPAPPFPCSPASSSPAASVVDRLRRGIDLGPTELRARLEVLREEVRRGRVWGLFLAIGALVVSAMGMVCWSSYRAATAAGYAELAPETSIARDADDPERLVLCYRPLSPGKIGFRRVDSQRQTELLDEVPPEAVDHPQQLYWRAPGLNSGDAITLVARNGTSLVTSRLAIPPRPPERSPSIYSLRFLQDRPQWIGRYGGTAATERAVAEGLRWLARHQADDGSWSNRCLGPNAPSKCDRAAPCTGAGDRFDMAQTGLAILAFQAAGHFHFNGNNYSDRVAKALEWLVARQRSDGSLLGSKSPAGKPYTQFMYEHGIATFALAEACAVTDAMGGTGDPQSARYRRAMEQAVKYMYRMQHDDGGWRYSDSPAERSDTSVTGWQVLAWKSAREARLPLVDHRVKRLRGFLNSCSADHGRTGYTDRNVSTEATTGVGMLARQFLFDQGDSPEVQAAARFLADYAEKTFWEWDDGLAPHAKPSGPGRKRRLKAEVDYYLWYNGTLAMFQAGGEPWTRWNRVVRDILVGLQEKEGCSRGSWSPRCRWGDAGGRVFSTALATLTLEVYYRYTSLHAPPEAIAH